jgi:hypothetical protein
MPEPGIAVRQSRLESSIVAQAIKKTRKQSFQRILSSRSHQPQRFVIEKMKMDAQPLSLCLDGSRGLCKQAYFRMAIVAAAPAHLPPCACSQEAPQRNPGLVKSGSADD